MDSYGVAFCFLHQNLAKTCKKMKNGKKLAEKQIMSIKKALQQPFAGQNIQHNSS